MQAGKLTNSRQLRKLSGRKSIGGRQSMSGGVRSSAMARGSFVANLNIRKTRSEESNDMDGIQEEEEASVHESPESPVEEVPTYDPPTYEIPIAGEVAEIRSKTPIEEARV